MAQGHDQGSLRLTKSKRIILNTLASYGRSVFAMFVGVFSSRWLLQGLGAQDLGLMGVVGSLIGAIVIFETVMQVAVARFYAYAIGESQRLDEDAGKDEIQRWFNVVFLIYTVLPALVVAFGYPLGIYAVRHWLVIPPERMEACLFVFRCSIATTFITMVSVPYIAMYQARQQIVELSVFQMVRTTINFFFTFSLLYVTCDRLKYSALFGAAVTLAILGTQMWRAWHQFPECRVKRSYLLDRFRLKQIFCYFFWEIFSCTGNMTRNQGSSIVVNKYFGPAANAAWSIANTLANQAMSLSSALTGALVPAVTTEEGAGEREKMIKLAFRTSKFGSLLILVFSVPLIAEMDEVLKLWLVNPPRHTAGLCACILIAYAIDKLALGHHVAISAKGKIGFYHSIVGSTFFLSVPIAIGLVLAGLGPLSVGVMFVICYSLVTVERIIFARWLVQMPVRHCLLRIVLPILIFSGVSYAGAAGVTFVLPPSFGRIVLTTLVALILMGLLGWKLVLDLEERQYVMAAVQKIRGRREMKMHAA